MSVIGNGLLYPLDISRHTGEGTRHTLGVVATGEGGDAHLHVRVSSQTHQWATTVTLGHIKQAYVKHVCHVRR